MTLQTQQVDLPMSFRMHNLSIQNAENFIEEKVKTSLAPLSLVTSEFYGISDVKVSPRTIKDST